MDNKIKEIKKLIKKPAKSVLALHLNPDGDSVGSNLAMAKILEKYGHQVDIYSFDPIPETYHFLLKNKKIINKSPCKINFSNYDIFWALDMTELSRCDHRLNKLNIKTIRIDHHLSGSIHFGDIVIADPQVASTAEILIQIFKKIDIEIDKTIAEYLIVGILSDTHYFLNSNTDTVVFKDICYLMQHGVDYKKIVYNLTRNLYYEDLIFTGQAIQRSIFNPKKKCIIIPIDNKLWTKYGRSLDKKDCLEKYIKAIHGTDFGIIISEKQKGRFNVSLRSRKPDFDVRKIAIKLGGGGHQAAAGITIKARSIKTVINKVLENI